MKISVIIPVFNAGDFIIPCLDSLCKQTTNQLEIILVDDHGQDDSMQKAHDFAINHPNLIIVFVDNGSNKGPGVARNTGIRAASGDYISFVDSDDTIDPDFCERLYNAANIQNADLACCDISFHYPDNRSTVKHNPITQGGDFTGRNKKKFLRRYVSYFTTFIYKRNFLLENGIVFPDTHSAEDACFLACALLSAKRIAVDKNTLYHYNIFPATISRKKDKSRYKNRIKSFKVFKQYAKRVNLYRKYWFEINLMVLKKGWLLALKDLLSN